MKKIALQLWSVNPETGKDFMGTLEKVAKMGYTGVEFAGYGGYDAETLRAKLNSLGLETVGAHVGYDALQKDPAGEIRFLVKLGARHITCPGAPMTTRKEVLDCAEVFNQVGKIAVAEGLSFSYHNHYQEFVKIDGEYALDMLYHYTDPKYVRVEPDIFWIQYAGVDPFDYVAKYGARCDILHFKQMRDLVSRENCDADDGCIDFRRMADLAESFGTTDFVYEQETFERDCLAYCEKSAKYLLKI